MSDIREKILSILEGIDESEIESDQGWWETSTGVEFGSKKKDEILEVIESLESKVSSLSDTSSSVSDSDKSDWYCRKCGYICDERVTFSETCDTCHQPVEVHTASDQTYIESLEASNKELKKTIEDLKVRMGLRPDQRLEDWMIING